MACVTGSPVIMMFGGSNALILPGYNNYFVESPLPRSAQHIISELSSFPIWFHVPKSSLIFTCITKHCKRASCWDLYCRKLPSERINIVLVLTQLHTENTQFDTWVQDSGARYQARTVLDLSNILDRCCGCYLCNL